jgi:predicted nucleic acid-binding protein
VQAAILDTGPIVGLLSDDDEHHAESVAAIRASGRKGWKLCTIWEVVGEAYTLFRMRIAPACSAEAALVVLRWAKESGIELLPTEESGHQRAAASCVCPASMLCCWGWLSDIGWKSSSPLTCVTSAR